MSVADLEAETEQPRDAVLAFLAEQEIPLRRIGTELFFLRELLAERFRRERRSPAAESSSEDEQERLRALDELRQFGMEVLRREGPHGTLVTVQVMAGWDVGFKDLDLSDDGGTLRPGEPHLLRLYISGNSIRGVVHFSATGFIDDDGPYLFVFRSSVLGTSFVRTQAELRRAWERLGHRKAAPERGMRRVGKRGLHLTFSPASFGWRLDQRFIVNRRGDEVVP
jgi:hypothetical protein